VNLTNIITKIHAGPMVENTNILDATSGSITFHYFQRSRPTYINLGRSRPFNDILLRLLLEFDSQGRSPHDVHLYINDVDITRALREVFMSVLEQDANGSIRKSYKDALDRHILAYGETNESIEEMKARARELLAQPLKSQFTERIGDFQHGWSGHLGLVNFLYRDVDFPEISLSSVVARHNENNGPVIELQTLDILTINFSHGLVGTLDPLPRGQLSFELVLDRVNPLLARLVAAEKRITELNEVARDLLQRITSLTSSVEKTDSRVSTIAKELSSTSQELHAFVDISKSKHNELDAGVNSIKEELKKRENRIIMKAQDGRETIHIDGDKGDIRLI